MTSIHQTNTNDSNMEASEPKQEPKKPSTSKKPATKKKKKKKKKVVKKKATVPKDPTVPIIPKVRKPQSAEAKMKHIERSTGFKFSDESKRKMSEKKKGANNPMFGTKRPDDVKKKISDFRKNTGFGEDNYNHKLTNLQRQEIRYKFTEFKFTTYLLATQYNVTERCIELIVQDLREKKVKKS